MSKQNLGWLYYKEMYAKGNNSEHIQNSFEKLLRVNARDESLEFLQSFTLTTTYPGLIIGSGYRHGIPNDEDSKMGFYFDFTSGLPTLPGSSIKGVLRSLFGYGKKASYKEQKHTFIKELLQKETLNVEKLAEEIFEGTKEAKPISLYKRDKFYEARIVKTSGGILQEDYITPHKEALKNPELLKIIKVGGGVTFEFSFELHDANIEGINVSADEKLTLFFELLQYHGMGAKTNVGYGQFEAKESAKLEVERKIKQDAIQQEQKRKRQEREAQQQEAKLQEALQSADTPAKKIELAIESMTDNRLIHECISGFALSDADKEELCIIIEKKIGPKPAPRNKAPIKWAIKIYELLGK